jgi:hydroxypyruvate isomerase
MLRFDLNVSILLREFRFLDRFDQAARMGFSAVEFWWPEDQDPRRVARHIRTVELEVAMFNFYGGDLSAGDRGLLNDPDREGEFWERVPAALELAYETGCRKINALIGKERQNESRESQLKRVTDNLCRLAEEARKAEATILLEALNTFDNGPCLVTRTEEAIALIEGLGLPNLAYQFDIYHMQRMEGNITANLERYLNCTGHIQAADSPGRNQPGTGELRFPFIFQFLEQSEYPGYVGLEYQPQGSSIRSLDWLPPRRRGALRASDLAL